MLYANYVRNKMRHLYKPIIAEAEGVPCVLEYSKGNYMKDYEIYGNSFQATRSGKNLLPYPYSDTTKTISGITFTDNGDGSVTVNGTATVNASYYFYRDAKNLINGLKTGDRVTVSIISDKTWVSSPTTMNIVCNYYDSTGTMKDGNCVINSTLKYRTITIGDDWVGIGMYVVVYSGQTIDNITLKPQVELGSVATEYEQYGVSPSPEFPSEVQSVGDLTTKNLIPYPYINSTMTYYGITFTDNNGVITLDGTTTLSETGVVDFGLMVKAKLEAGTYTLSGCPKTGAIYTYRFFVNITHDDNTHTYINEIGNGSTFTVTNTDLVTITIRIGGQLGTVSNLVFKPQLEKGSSATEYEPYHKYDIPITVAGKNLFDMETILPEQGWVKQDDGSYYVENASIPYKKVLWENAEGYTGQLKILFTFKYLKATVDSSAGVSIHVFYADGTFVTVQHSSAVEADTWYVSNYNTITNSSKTVQKIQWSYGTGLNSSWVKDIIITKDITATEYEPYRGNITSHIYLDEPLRKIGDYADYIDFKNQKVIRNIKEITLNGSENWRLQGTNENGIISFIYSISNETAPSTISIPALSTHYSYKTTSLSNTTEQGFFVQRGAGVTNIYIRMLNEDIADIAAFKTWLSENNVMIYYQMATPTEEPISLPTLQTFKNTTIMSVDTTVLPSNIKVTYIRT